CGGCRLQDLAYDAQLDAKATQVLDALERLGGLEGATLEPVVPAVEAFGYRNKLEWSFTQTPAGPALGFHRAGRWDEVLEIERCWLPSGPGNEIRHAGRDGGAG